jgi:dihydrofolate reductase
MGIVAADISVSLDGFVAGPNDGPELGLGEGGERLHEWIVGLKSWRERHGLEGGESNHDAEVLDEAFRNVGAIVLGKRMYDNAKGWGDDPPFKVPVFVLSHQPLEKIVKGETSFDFVSGGIEKAVKQASSAAGGGDVSISGGASTIQQTIAAGLLDQIQIHLVPILLGGGVRLFEGLDPERTELELTRVIESPSVTHLRYRVAA